MAAMVAEVSRALATFISNMGLGQTAARALAAEYGTAGSVSDLPEWLTEQPLAPQTVRSVMKIRSRPWRAQQ